MPIKQTMKIRTRAEAEQALGTFARRQSELNGLKSELDIQLNAVRARYEGQIDALSKAVELDFLLIQQWADEHPEEFPERRKSIDFVHGTIGYRTTPPRVDKVRTRERLADIAAKLSATPWGQKYVRRPDPSINKDKLLDDRQQITPEQLRSVGLKITQREEFYASPKTETLEQGASAA